MLPPRKQASRGTDLMEDEKTSMVKDLGPPQDCVTPVLEVKDAYA